jgi:hypothetical protein
MAFSVTFNLLQIAVRVITRLAIADDMHRA